MQGMFSGISQSLTSIGTGGGENGVIEAGGDRDGKADGNTCLFLKCAMRCFLCLHIGSLTSDCVSPTVMLPKQVSQVRRSFLHMGHLCSVGSSVMLESLQVWTPLTKATNLSAFNNTSEQRAMLSCLQ